MTAGFALGLLVSTLLMKAAAWRACSTPDERRALVLTGVPSLITWRRAARPSAGDVRRRLLRALAWLLPAAAGVLACREYFSAGLPSVAGSYLAAIPIVSVGMALSPLVELSALPRFARVLPRYHDDPWRAAGPGEFWSRRWNTWQSDWFRAFVFHPLRKLPKTAGFVVFAVSGLWHEVLINVPYYVVTHRSLFGTMLGYFVIQFVGTSVERVALGRWPAARRVLLFVVVIGPLPLFANDALIAIFHLRPAP